MIDTHSHIFEPEFSEDLPEVVARAKEVGVEKIFMPNIDDTTIDAMTLDYLLYQSLDFNF